MNNRYAFCLVLFLFSPSLKAQLRSAPSLSNDQAMHEKLKKAPKGASEEERLLVLRHNSCVMAQAGLEALEMQRSDELTSIRSRSNWSSIRKWLAIRMCNINAATRRERFMDDCREQYTYNVERIKRQSAQS